MELHFVGTSYSQYISALNLGRMSQSGKINATMCSNMAEIQQLDVFLSFHKA